MLSVNLGQYSVIFGLSVALCWSSQWSYLGLPQLAAGALLQCLHLLVLLLGLLQLVLQLGGLGAILLQLKTQTLYEHQHANCCVQTRLSQLQSHSHHNQHTIWK